MILGYIRTSTDHQNTDRQLDGVKVDEYFVDQISGGTVQRPELQRMMDFSRKGDEVVCHQIDRMGRSLTDLMWIVETLVNKGVTVRFHKENLVFNGDKSDPISVLMLQLLGSVSQFEKSLINNRVREGVHRAKLLGKYTGRKRSVSEDTVQKILILKDKGYKKTEICKELGLSRTTVYRYLYDPVNGGCKNPKIKSFESKPIIV